MTGSDTNTPKEMLEAKNDIQKTADAKEFAVRKWIEEKIELLANDASVDMKTLVKSIKDGSVERVKVERLIADFLAKKINSPEWAKLVFSRDDIDPLMKNFQEGITTSIIENTILRQKKERSLIEVIEKWFDPTSMTPAEISDFVAKQADSDITKMVANRPFTEKMLRKSGLAPTDRAVANVVADLGITLDPDGERLLEEYVKKGFLQEEGVRKIIDNAASLSLAGKQKVLAYFLPTVSLKLLRELNIVDAAREKSLIEKAFLDELEKHDVIAPGENYFDPTLPPDELRKREWHLADFAYSFEHDADKPFIATKTLAPADIEDFFVNGTEDSKAFMQKMLEAESAAVQEEIETQDNLASFADMVTFLEKKLKSSGNVSKVSDFASLSAGKFIISDRADNQKKHWKIEDESALLADGKNELEIRGFTDMGDDAGTEQWSYGRFVENFLAEVHHTRGVAISDDAQFLDPTMGYGINGMDDFEREIDRIDSDNRGKKFAVGMACTMNVDGRKEYIRITDIKDVPVKTIQFQDFTGQKYPPISWEEFLALIDPEMTIRSEFHRFGDISTPQKFAENAGIVGLTVDDKWQLACGEDEKTKKPIKLWGFRHADKNEYLEVELDAQGRVTLTEYVRKDKTDNPGGNKEDINKVEKSVIAEGWTLEFLKQYLEERKDEFTTPVNYNPLKTKEAFRDDGTIPEGHWHDHGHWHKRSKLGMLFSAGNIGDFIKGVKMGWHMIEHMLEESRDLRAAEALYNGCRRTLWEDHSMTLHAMAEFAGKVGEMVDKKMNHLKHLSAGARRAEIRHILLTKPPKPFDLMAAMTVTVEMSGVLYPDSHLDDLQGNNYLWFRQLCAALNCDYDKELNKAISKERLEYPNSPHLHETILITRFLKTNSEKNPYIQSFKGGSKFWGAVSRGRAEQTEKGQKEAKERNTATGREAYAMAKYKSNELEIVVGAFPEIFDKDTDPWVLSPAFVWSMSNATRIAHPELLDKFRKNILGDGLTFHALSFSGKNADAKVYQDTVTLVTERLVKQGKLPKKALADLTKLNEVRDASPDAHNPDLYIDLGKFWNTYHAVLNPALQGSDPMLFLLLQDDELKDAQKGTVRKYIKTLKDMTGAGRLKDKDPNPMLLMMDSYNYTHSQIFDTNDTGDLYSLNLQLSYIQLNSRTAELHNKNDQYLWNKSIVPYLESLRKNDNFVNNPEYQKRQFLALHDEIVSFLKQKLNAIPKETYNHARTDQLYLWQLDKLGFDVSYENLFSTLGKTDFWGEEAYARFVTHTSGTARTVSQVKNRFNDAIKMGSTDEKWGTDTQAA